MGTPSTQQIPSGGTTPEQPKEPLQGVSLNKVEGWSWARIKHITKIISIKVGLVLGVSTLAGHAGGKFIGEHYYQKWTGYNPATASSNNEESGSATAVPAATPSIPSTQAPATEAPTPPAAAMQQRGDRSGGMLGKIQNGMQAIGEAATDLKEGIKDAAHELKEGATEAAHELKAGAKEMIEDSEVGKKIDRIDTFISKLPEYGNDAAYWLMFSICSFLAAWATRRATNALLEYFYPNDKLLLDNVNNTANVTNQAVERLNENTAEIADLRSLIIKMDQESVAQNRAMIDAAVAAALPTAIVKALEKQIELEGKISEFMRTASAANATNEEVKHQMGEILTAVKDNKTAMELAVASALEEVSTRMESVAQTAVTDRFRKALAAHTSKGKNPTES